MLRYYIGLCSALAVIKTVTHIRGSSEYKYMEINNHFTLPSKTVSENRDRMIETQLKDNLFHITMFPVIRIIRMFA